MNRRNMTYWCEICQDFFHRKDNPCPHIKEDSEVSQPIVEQVLEEAKKKGLIKKYIEADYYEGSTSTHKAIDLKDALKMVRDAVQKAEERCQKTQFSKAELELIKNRMNWFIQSDGWEGEIIINRNKKVLQTAKALLKRLDGFSAGFGAEGKKKC